MKCEHCGKNEVTFMYRSNINGTVTEKHLCQSCAEELGYTKQLALHARPRLGGWFGSFWDDDFFDDFFKPSFALHAPAKEEVQEEELMDKAEQERFSRLRRLNALRLEKEQAVHSEDYERAAELRDEIRKLEDMGETA